MRSRPCHISRPKASACPSCPTFPPTSTLPTIARLLPVAPKPTLHYRPCTDDTPTRPGGNLSAHCHTHRTLLRHTHPLPAAAPMEDSPTYLVLAVVALVLGLAAYTKAVIQPVLNKYA